MPKFGTTNAIFWYFWAKILKKLLSHLKSSSSNLSICKTSRKSNNAQIWAKNALFGYFLGQNFKKLLSYFKSAPSNLSKNVALTDTVDFRIGSAFSKGPGSLFLKVRVWVWVCCCILLLSALGVGAFDLNENSTPISHYDTSHRLRYLHLRYIKCLFTNIQKQYNTLKSSLFLKKSTNVTGV